MTRQQAHKPTRKKEPEKKQKGEDKHVVLTQKFPRSPDRNLLCLSLSDLSKREATACKND